MEIELELLISDIGLDVIKNIAPEEIPLYLAHSKSFFNQPKDNKKNKKDEMLGFGNAETVILITPLVLALTTEALKTISEIVAEKIKDEKIQESLVSILRKLFHKDAKKNKASPSPLSQEQLELVRKAALKKAKLIGLSEVRSKLIADSIVGQLSTQA